jgi:hypothetical protein
MPITHKPLSIRNVDFPVIVLSFAIRGFERRNIRRTPDVL